MNYMNYDAFTIVTNSKCYFCEEQQLILFSEHWTFCPGCSAIYSRMVLVKTTCEHIHEGIPVVENNCWFPVYREMKTYIKCFEHDKQECSVCGATCYADGW